jgi:hypothetical protein
MKPAARCEVADGAALRDASALMAAEAERLLVVAARAGGIVVSRSLGVKGKVVVGVNAAGSNAAIVAGAAFGLGVAARAGLTVVTSDRGVAFDEVGAVGEGIRMNGSLLARRGKARVHCTFAQSRARASSDPRRERRSQDQHVRG